VERYGLTKPYILSVGQWREHKNLIRLVEAFATLQKDPKWRGKIDLAFVGREDPKYPYLRQKITELNLGKFIKVTGFVEDEDLPIIYNCANLFVIPSLSEGFGLPGLEAQACGVPVVSSDRTCLPEVYGKGAIYFNPLKVEDIAEKILLVLGNKKLASELIVKGEENAKKFTWENSAQKTLAVYREILYK
jgi:glycosyltransferase involved in cell wall biosynthesis